MLVVFLITGVFILLGILYIFHLKREIRRIIEWIEHNEHIYSVNVLDKDIENLALSINKRIKEDERKEHQLKKQDKNFKKMVANLSHDLRTPLTVIIGYLQLIRLECQVGCPYLSMLAKELTLTFFCINSPKIRSSNVLDSKSGSTVQRSKMPVILYWKPSVICTSINRLHLKNYRKEQIMPKPFLNKLIVHGAIGFFCVLFGCIYGFVTHDQIFLLMSLCIGVGTAIRIVSLLHTIKMHDYTELTGTCTKREVSPLTKKQKIIFRSTDQKEYHFTFDKNIRLLSGHYYRLYFRNVANLSGEEKVTPDLLAYEELSLNEDVSPKNS